MSNLDVWNKVKRPPPTALKTIKAGRLQGMSDINPQWRLEVMTDVFGQIGVGWYYDIVKFWTEPGAQGELMAFAHIHLFTKVPPTMVVTEKYDTETRTSDNGHWSAPISGIGGSALVAKESAGLRANDEAYKMAVTDALSVAMKQLGVAADIYAGLWDGSKYKDEPTAAAPRVQLPKLTDAEAKREYEKWIEVKSLLVDEDGDQDQEKIANEWGKLPSNVRSAIKRHGDLIAPVTQNDANTKQHIASIN